MLARFRDRAEAEACDRALREAGIIVRKVAGYKLPAALRITVGDEEACGAGRRGGRAFHAGAGVIAYRHVALIGLGLIASSISHAIRRTGAPVRITGHARTPETRAEAARLGLAEVFESAGDAVEGADLVILCVPVGAMAGVAAEIAPRLAPGATVSDVGSVKRAVIAAVAPQLPGVAFVPAHPLAGTEHSGPGSGFAALFDNRWCLLTPLPETDPAAVARARRASGPRSARASTRWTPTTTTWCWR